MTNLFLSQPSLFVHDTIVDAVQQNGEGEQCIAPAENIFRPAGGGQPWDKGATIIGGAEIRVGGVYKQEGRTWLALGSPTLNPVEVGCSVRLKVDSEFRNRLSRCHSLVHLLMAATRNVIGGYESKGATIHPDGDKAELRFRANEAVSGSALKEIDILGRYLIALNRPIRVEKARSPQDAAARFKQWRVDPDLGLSGKIRVIDIAGIDQNPCSGSHLDATGAIGPYEILSNRVNNTEINLLSVSLLRDWQKRYGDGAINACNRVDLSAFDLD